MFFDTHAHISDKQFESDRQQVIEDFEKEHVLGIIEVATSEENSKFAANLAQENDKIFASAGIHPHDSKDVSNDYIATLAALLEQPKVIAIGEIGLDFHYDFSKRDVQQKVFESQLSLAMDLKKPVILHSREATKPMMDTLKRYKGLKGVMHCFSSSEETAKEVIDLGLYISFTGPLTFKNAHNVRKSFDAVPLSRLMAETDCPYMAPEPMRGKRNEPKYVQYVLRKMAELRDINLEEMCRINIENTKELFEITIDE